MKQEKARDLHNFFTMFSLSDATSANSVCLPIIIKGSDGRWQQLNITTNAMMENNRKVNNYLL